MMPLSYAMGWLSSVVYVSALCLGPAPSASPLTTKQASEWGKRAASSGSEACAGERLIHAAGVSSGPVPWTLDRPLGPRFVVAEVVGKLISRGEDRPCL
jgi:hypothetical protein